MSKSCKSYVVGFVFRGSQVLLIEKKRPKWQAGRLNGIGGHVEEGETPLTAMIRECLEEANLDTVPQHWTEAVVLVHSDWCVRFFFMELLQVKGDKPYLVEQKTDERLLWVSVDDLPDNVVYNLRWLIPLMKDTVAYPIVIQDIGAYDFGAEG